MSHAAASNKVQEALDDFNRTGKFDARQFLRKPAKTGDADRDAKLSATFGAKLKILALLETLPDDEAHVCLGALQAKISKVGTAGDEYWPATVKTIAKKPTEFKATLLRTQVPDLKLDRELIAKLDKHNPRAISNLFSFVYAVHDTTPLSQDMMNKVVFERTLLKRRRALQRPSAEWLQKAWQPVLGGATSVDWAVAGCYTIVKVQIVFFGGSD